MSLVINHSSSVQSSSHAAPNDHHQPESGKSLSEKESTHLAGGAEKADKPVLVAINELSKYNKVSRSRSSVASRRLIQIEHLRSVSYR